MKILVAALALSFFLPSTLPAASGDTPHSHGKVTRAKVKAAKPKPYRVKPYRVKPAKVHKVGH